MMAEIHESHHGLLVEIGVYGVQEDTIYVDLRGDHPTLLVYDQEDPNAPPTEIRLPEEELQWTRLNSTSDLKERISRATTMIREWLASRFTRST